MKNDEIAKIVTNTIIEELQNGIIPWDKPWDGGFICWSRSTGKPYSLLNTLLLQSQCGGGEYATFNQISKEGGKVNKGAKSSVVTFWKTSILVDEDKQPILDDDGKQRYIPLLRYYRVFNIKDTTLDQKCNTEEMKRKFIDDKSAESVMKEYVVREKISLKHIRGDKAYYAPISDEVVLPYKKQFKSIEMYYGTAFHELSHSTGHSTRLNRGLLDIAGFGTENYSKEELVAELSSAMLLKVLGIDNSKTRDNNTAYIQSWLRALQNDTKMLISASAKADKAYKFILGVEA